MRQKRRRLKGLLLPELSLKMKKDEIIADPRIQAAIEAGIVSIDSTKAELIAAI